VGKSCGSEERAWVRWVWSLWGVVIDAADFKRGKGVEEGWRGIAGEREWKERKREDKGMKYQGKDGTGKTDGETRTYFSQCPSLSNCALIWLLSSALGWERSMLFELEDRRSCTGAVCCGSGCACCWLDGLGVVIV
jgi:hypothetical protein